MYFIYHFLHQLIAQKKSYNATMSHKEMYHLINRNIRL
jgi:hypothetical protein